MPLADLELEWTRTWGLGLLALPVLLLVLARLRTRPPEQATGTLPVWRRISTAAPSSARSNRPRVPPYLWLLALSLTLGAVAFAGPRGTRPAAPRTWTVLLDHSASTRLPWLAEPGRADSGDSRLERSLEELFAWMEEDVRDEDTVVWRTGAGSFRTSGAERPPRANLFPPRFPLDPPDWSAHDRPGVLWVTDGAPASGPEAAGLFASGGAAVHGPIAADGRDRLDWDAAADGSGEGRLVRVADAVEPGRVHAHPELVRPVADLLGVWCESRGLRAPSRSEDSGDAADARLVVLAGPAEPDGLRGPVPVGRDGWSATARVALGLGAPELLPPPWEAWLWAPGAVPEEAQAVVHAAPGRVDVRLREMSDPTGDPAAFAVSWSRLFDDSLLPPPGVVALADRLDAGEPRVRPPTPPPSEELGESRWIAAPFDAWLAVAAALLALAAIATGLAAGLPARGSAGR